MKKTVAIFLLSIICTINATGQQERDLKKEYENFRNQAKQQYEDFRAQANAEYARFMRAAWQQYKGEAPIPKPEVPDLPKPPVRIPEEEQDKIPDNNPVPYDEVIPPPVVIDQPKPVAPVPEIPQPQEKQFSFTVFGTQCTVRLSDGQRFTLPDCKENTIADTWAKLSQSQYNNLIHDCLELRTRLNLCDWAYLMLLQQLSSSFSGANSNEAVLLAAFLYSQSGYKMRLARSETNRLYFMIASRHIIYKMSYYNIDEEYFYPLNCSETRLFICNLAFPKEQSLSLSIGKEQYFTEKKSVQRTLTSERYPHVSVSVSSNQNLIDFYNTYPLSQINNDATSCWSFYANTPLSQSVETVLYPVLRAAIKDKSEEEAANILINFVQTAFDYGYDAEIWGGERPFFPEETIYYPFSDCEDRAILFSRLIRDLTGLKVALLYYPGHLATAVQFNETVSGDYLMVNNNRYLVCDPTYIGAKIGKTMPNMDNNKATVVFPE